MSCNLTTTKPTNRPATRPMTRLAGLAAALVLAGGAQAQQGSSATKPAPVLSSPLPAGAGTAVPSLLVTMELAESSGRLQSITSRE